MTQLSGGPGFQQPRAKAENDIYTVMVIIGFVVVAAAIGFVIYRSNELFGVPFPKLMS